MRFLLDTHTLIWFLIDDPRLSKQATELICEADNEPLLSIASLWEIAIKSSLGKLVLKKTFDDLFPRELTKNGIGVLTIDIDHLSVSTKAHGISSRAVSNGISTRTSSPPFSAFHSSRS